jgi:hypothetical protein
MTDERFLTDGAQDKLHGEKRDAGRALASKIARLPEAIREQLNRRIRDGQAGAAILAWFNELPEVKKVLAEQFEGVPISHKNLSKWRHGGYERWLERQEPFAEVAALAGDAEVFSRVSGDKLARGTAAIVAARILKLIRDTPPEKWTADELVKISHAVTALAQVEQNSVRLENEKTGMHLRNEMVTLQWDKHQRDVVEIMQHVLEDEQTKQLQKLPVSNQAKIELIGRRHFGKFWIPREVPETRESSGKTLESKGSIDKAPS